MTSEDSILFAAWNSFINWWYCGFQTILQHFPPGNCTTTWRSALLDSSINWSTIQKESYAIYYCFQQLDYLIRDRKFTIHTDHMNLTDMKQNPTSMVTIAMQELDFTVHFVKGSDNELADALSRLCPNLTQVALPLTIATNHDTSSSSAMSSTMSALMVIEPLTDEQHVYIQMCHNAIVGHNGVDRTLTRLFSLNQAWKNMKQHVRSFIRNCPCCQKLSTINPKINSEHFSTSIHAIFDTLNIDYLGPFPDKGYILVIPVRGKNVLRAKLSSNRTKN